MNQEKMTKLIKRIIISTSIMFLVIIAAMLVGNAWYTIYAYDDFGHANTVGAFNVGFFEYLKASVVFTIEKYMNWQGTYFSMFLQAFLSPLNNGGLLQLRIVMVANAVFLISSLVLFIWTLVGYIQEGVKFEIRIFIVALFFLQMFTSIEYPEIFSWFSGATCYSFPLSFLLISVSLAFIADRNNKRLPFILSLISGILGMGGVLGITGMGCSFMLVIVAIPLLFEKKIKKKMLIIFAVDFIFALVGTFAPGNFLRRGQVDAPFNPVKAVFMAAKKTFYGIESLYKDTGFIVIWLLFIALGVMVCNLISIDLRKYAVASILMLLVPYATIFPIVLGYGGYVYFPNRCIFLMNLTLTLVLLNLGFLAGCVFGRFIKNDYGIKTASGVITILAVSIMLLIGKRAEDNVAFIQINNLLNGRVKAYYSECNAMIGVIQNSEEEDVVFDRLPWEVPHFSNFYISDDETYWVNADIAKMYNKSSVRIKEQ